MAKAEFRIVLSAVSSEFRSARSELTDDFGARDVLIRVQEQLVPDRRLHTLLQPKPAVHGPGDEWLGRVDSRPPIAIVCSLWR